MKRILFGFLFSTLVSQVSLAQSTIDIFGNAVPETNVVADPHQATLGVKFYSQVPGTISGIRFYRGYTNTNGYNVRLYTTAGSQLGGASTNCVCRSNLERRVPIHGQLRAREQRQRHLRYLRQSDHARSRAAIQ